MVEDKPLASTAPQEAKGGKQKKGNMAIVTIAAMAIVALVVGLQMCQSERFKPVDAGSVAPPFILEDLQGKKVTLEDYRGKVVFINIWATWCDPCREEMPSMEMLYRSLKGRPFEILAVSVDRDKDKVIAFRDEFKLTFPILLDRRRKITRIYRTTGVPETFIIDSNGLVAEKVIGARNWADKSNIKKIMELVAKAEGTPGKDGGGAENATQKASSN